jgi:hypothetical protein
LKALFICKNLLEAIRREEIVQGQVHSVFNNACNIETDHEFITLLCKDKGMAPMGVIVDSGEQVNFKNLKITQNCIFNFSVNGIYCKEKNIFINLYGAEKWFPGVIVKPFNCLENELLENIKTMEFGLISQGKLYGIGPLISMLSYELPDLGLLPFQIYSPDKGFEFIKYRFLNFIQALVTAQMKGITEIAENIIGFGPGLTPAMDDFISGVIISFIYLGNYYKLNIPKIYEFNRKIVSKGMNKTTRVSSEMLKHSSIGETNQGARELMGELLNPHNEENIMKALLNIIGYGETSGTDTAFGIYVGSKIFTNLKYRRSWLNESLHGY